MVHVLRVYIIIPEEQSPDPSTHIKWLTMASGDLTPFSPLELLDVFLQNAREKIQHTLLMKFGRN